MISAAKSQTRHIILFADAADSEQSVHYEDIVDKLREAGVTVSVVGLGTDARRGCQFAQGHRTARRRRLLFQRQPGRNPAHLCAGHLHRRAQHVC